MKALKSSIYFHFLIIWSLSSFLSADVPFPMNPDYISKDVVFYSTGCAFSDIDGNGFLDLVFSNGNDMGNQPEILYYNYTGIPETSYNWISWDSDYSGHLAIGDLDGDGDPDLVVANFVDKGPLGQFEKAISKIYYNVDGMFENQPSWQSTFSNNSFSVALGDVDGDGDLDIAFANGQIYGGELQQNTIYKNNSGVIEQIPSWFSEEAFHSMDLVFGDFNNDGLLDIAYANGDAPITIHYNTGSGLSQSLSWVSDDSALLNSITTGDFNSDGLADLAVTTMTSYLTEQNSDSIFAKSGACKIYFN
ncbi:VCBS repeat-containing protein, partial [bacterium]|nr:VCBS repeat-containing protein [bacterium]